MEELKRTAASFGPFSGDSEAAAAIACAEAAAPGDPLRDAYLARRQLDELDCRNQALFEARVREQSALDAAAEAEAREAEDLFVRQELELMVDGLPWAPDHPPCSGGIVDDVLQHVHGALPEDALDMSADLACVFEAPAGEVPAGEVPAGEVPAGASARCPPARCTAGARQRRGAGAQFEMDEEVIRRSNEQQRAAAGSSAAVAPAGRGRWQRTWPGELRRPWRGLCSTSAARAPNVTPKGGPGSLLRPSDTVIAARLASAQQRAARRDLDRGNRGRWRRAAAREARAAGRGLCAT